MESAGSVDDPLRPQIGGVRAGRRAEEVLSAALHPAVEDAPVPEVEVRQPRLPLGAKEGGGDRVGLAVVFRHDSGPLVAVLDLEALLVSRRQVPVPHEVVAGEVEEGLVSSVASNSPLSRRLKFPPPPNEEGTVWSRSRLPYRRRRSQRDRRRGRWCRRTWCGRSWPGSSGASG